MTSQPPTAEEVMSRFPRPLDDLGHAWGLCGNSPEMPWERFSPAYEARLEGLAQALERCGYKVRIGGAGGQDGEFIVASHDAHPSIFQHLEDPNEDQAIEALLRELTDALGKQNPDRP